MPSGRRGNLPAGVMHVSLLLTAGEEGIASLERNGELQAAPPEPFVRPPAACLGERARLSNAPQPAQGLGHALGHHRPQQVRGQPQLLRTLMKDRAHLGGPRRVLGQPERLGPLD